MPEYDLNRMQADAVRRAREMQSRARAANRQRQQTAQPPQPQQPEPAPPPAADEAPMPEPAAPPEPPAREQSAAVIGTPQNSLLENLFQDKERAIILALLILLSGEGDNHELMFALMFLLM